MGAPSCPDTRVRECVRLCFSACNRESHHLDTRSATWQRISESADRLLWLVAIVNIVSVVINAVLYSHQCLYCNMSVLLIILINAI